MVIAERTLRLRNPDGEHHIPIRIFAPERDETSWMCRYQIAWPEGQQNGRAGGADSVQALVLALQMIGADIYTSSYHQSGRLTTETPGGGYGFPVPAGIRDLLQGDDAKFF
ncbi:MULTISPECIES: hypothetical protein [unclassified Chelatococcus]|uniref:DUF6968 family protein n=1 Tax=unclassified Chelatococcus TaxID=2638111 RepID=UPI001BCA74AC|nr:MULTISPECIES: hypothetical protein [unclassified Chelatococcus]CAH1652057.1 conserved hypothetical protein [Hyphomicrobiales bacterium]MBS7739934.1 hypothetical protein [Chelatococcus sp. HY11]MBX3545638.1 hypothetical protein [Chelatococcus sp.]MCO5078766.1 hypothetical protein [Chelatococcus sp.]CAH1686100.1 conserved hypothetical protein [Hyphomicrobiales bacterium]